MTRFLFIIRSHGFAKTEFVNKPVASGPLSLCVIRPNYTIGITPQIWGQKANVLCSPPVCTLYNLPKLCRAYIANAFHRVGNV